MIADNILLFFILFMLIYICEDSFFALLILVIFSMYQVGKLLTTSITESEVQQMYLFILLLTYSVLSLYYWTTRFNMDGTPKQRGVK